MSEKKTEKQTHLKWFGIPRLLPFLKPYRRLFLQLMVFGLISSLGRSFTRSFSATQSTTTLPRERLTRSPCSFCCTCA